MSNSNILKTTEVSSPGIYAASIGGGGGRGGGTLAVAVDATMPSLMGVLEEVVVMQVVLVLTVGKQIHLPVRLAHRPRQIMWHQV